VTQRIGLRPATPAESDLCGLALSTVVAGLGVLGSIGPTPRAALATRPRPSSTMTTVTGSATAPTTAPTMPTGINALAGYAGPRPPAVTGPGGYPTPVLTPTTTAASPPPPTTTGPGDTYTMTYDSGTVVIIYPGGADGSGGGYPDGGGHR
jgi:hypothetical protein